MKSTILFSSLLSILLSITACNAKTGSQTGAQATKGADPIPQSGGYSNIDNAKLQEFLNQDILPKCKIVSNPKIFAITICPNSWDKVPNTTKKGKNINADLNTL